MYAISIWLVFIYLGFENTFRKSNHYLLMKNLYLELNYKIHAFIAKEESRSVYKGALSSFFRMVAIGENATPDSFGVLKNSNEILNEYIAGGLNMELRKLIEKNILSLTKEFIRREPSEKKILDRMHEGISWRDKETVNYIILVEFLSARANFWFMPSRACRLIRLKLLKKYSKSKALPRRKKTIDIMVTNTKKLINPAKHRPFADGHEYLQYVTRAKFGEAINGSN